MTPFWTSALLWLAQVSVAASVLMLLALALGRLTRQPARRQRVYEFGLAAALLAAALSLAPSWLVIGLPLSSQESTPELQAASLPEHQDLWVELVSEDDSIADAMVPVEKETSAANQGAGHNQASALPWGWLAGGILLTVYLLGIAYFLTRWVGGQLCLRRLIRRTEPVPAEVDDLFQTLNGQRSWPRLLLSRLLRVPISCGFWRPKVVLPAELCEPNERPKLAWVFAHELTHVERRDALSTLLLTVGQALFFHLPWFWWLKRRVRLCQEYVADAAAVADRAAADYAEFLLSLTQTKALPLGATGVTGQVSDLYRRVIMLLQNPLRVEKRCPRWWSWGLAGGLLAVAVLVGGIGLQAAAGDTIVIIVPGEKAKEAPTTKEKQKLSWVVDSDQGNVIVLRLDEKGNVVHQGVAKEKSGIVRIEDPGKPKTPILSREGRTVLTLPQGQSVVQGQPLVVLEGTHGKEVVKILTSVDGALQMIVTDGKVRHHPQVNAAIEWHGIAAKDNDRLKKAIMELEALIKDREKQGDNIKEARELAEKLRQAVERLKKELPSRKADPAKKAEAKGQIVPLKVEFEYKVPQLDYLQAITPQVNPQYNQYLQLYQPSTNVDLKKLEKLLDKLQADPSKVDPKEIKQALEELRRGVQGWAGTRYLWAPNTFDGKTWLNQPNTAWSYSADGIRESGKGRFGIRLNTPSADLAEHLGLPKGEGMVIEEVYADTAAAKAGLKAKDIILKLGNTPIPRDQDKALKIFADVKDGDSVDATILRKGKEGVIKGIKPVARAQDATARFWAVRPHGTFAYGEPIPEKGAVVTLRRDGDKFTAKHQEKNSTISIEGTVKDGKVTPTGIVIQEGGKTILKSKTTADVPEAYRARVERLLGLSAYEPASQSRRP